MTKKLETNQRVIGMLNDTVTDFVKEARNGGVRTGNLELVTEENIIIHHSPVNLDGPEWNKDYPETKGRVSVNFYPGEKLSRVIDTDNTRSVGR